MSRLGIRMWWSTRCTVHRDVHVTAKVLILKCWCRGELANMCPAPLAYNSVQAVWRTEEAHPSS